MLPFRSLPALWMVKSSAAKNINIAAGGSVNGGTVPDSGSAWLLMSLGLGVLAMARKKFVG
ncbi:MAG TPA: VPDSG-CTERM sorting domain-containing protein [Verrucomicrobiae bacterium]|nr:VPDSG-CTERM sorting domain-containing protein [Verrucomicrobiae bacterium]